MARKKERIRLRKQPKMRKMHSSTTVKLPHATVPKTAKKRRQRRQTHSLRKGLDLLKRFIFNARWISLGLLGLTIYALYIISDSEEYRLTYLPIQGAMSVPPEEIVQASHLAGRHIFAADPVAAAESITTIPGVISSTVTLSWPNQVHIQVAEEPPVAIWQEDGIDYWIIGNGRLVPARTATLGMVNIVADMSNTLALSAPFVEEEISDSNETAVDGAETVETSLDDPTSTEEQAPQPTPLPTPAPTPLASAIVPAAVIEAQEEEAEKLPTSLAFIPDDILIGALQMRELRPNIDQLFYRPSGGLSFEDERGWRVYLGTGTNMNQKLIVYETIVEHLQGRAIQPTYISISNIENPFYGLQ